MQFADFQSNIYPDLLKDYSGIGVLTLSKEQINLINSIIYSELVKGIIRNESKERVVKIKDDLIRRRAQYIIPGSTEIPLLIHQGDPRVPVIDTTNIHAISAVDASVR